MDAQKDGPSAGTGCDFFKYEFGRGDRSGAGLGRGYGDKERQSCLR